MRAAEAGWGTRDSERPALFHRRVAPTPFALIAESLGPAWIYGEPARNPAGRTFFALSIDQYDGSLRDYRVMSTWQPKPWAGIGIGYNGFTVDVDVDGGGFNASLDWTYDGPIIFYSASF